MMTKHTLINNTSHTFNITNEERMEWM